jgi:hypothetical protein
VRLFPSDEVDEIGDGAGTDRFMSRVSCLAADDSLLHVDGAEKTNLIAQCWLGAFLRSQAEE